VLLYEFCLLALKDGVPDSFDVVGILVPEPEEVGHASISECHTAGNRLHDIPREGYIGSVLNQHELPEDKVDPTKDGESGLSFCPSFNLVECF